MGGPLARHPQQHQVYGLKVRSSSQGKIIHFLPKKDIILLCGPPAGVGFGFFDLTAEPSTDGFKSTRKRAQKRQVHAEDVNAKSNLRYARVLLGVRRKQMWYEPCLGFFAGCGFESASSSVTSSQRFSVTVQPRGQQDVHKSGHVNTSFEQERQNQKAHKRKM